MRYFVVFVLVLMTGCEKAPNTGYMTQSTPDSETGVLEKIHYSPYYEFEHLTEDGLVLARLVITLGPTRVPEGFQHTGIYAQDLQGAYEEGIIDWVSEIYFINSSESGVVVEPLNIKVGSDRAVLNGTYAIEPSTWKITEPLIALNSAYGTEVGVELKFNYKGQEQRAKGIARRLTVVAMAEKYDR